MTPPLHPPPLIIHGNIVGGITYQTSSFFQGEYENNNSNVTVIVDCSRDTGTETHFFMLEDEGKSS